jgi:hypothetical protein
MEKRSKKLTNESETTSEKKSEAMAVTGTRDCQKSIPGKRIHEVKEF